MNITDEMLSAYLDGELDKAEADLVRRELETSEVLRQQLAAIEQASQKASAYISQIDDKPMSQNLVTLLDTLKQRPEEKTVDDNIMAFSSGQTQRKHWSQWTLPLAASIALIIGFGAGQFSSPGGNDATLIALIDQTNGLVQNANPLHIVLEEKPSGVAVRLAGSRLITATPILSFRATSGDFCREIIIAGELTASRNLACKKPGGAWQILAMTAMSVADNTGYLPASDDASSIIDQQIAALVDGSPLGQGEEAEMIARKWRSDQ